MESDGVGKDGSKGRLIFFTLFFFGLPILSSPQSELRDPLKYTNDAGATGWRGESC